MAISLVQTGIKYSTNETQTDADIGFGQTWTDVTASRSVGTNYTNSTTKPIVVSARTNQRYDSSMQAVVNGVMLMDMRPAVGYGSTANYTSASINFIVPPGASYTVRIDYGVAVMTGWYELR